MGYFVSSILAIGKDDPHRAFVYFLPTRRVKYEWINDWVYERFSVLATKLGPDAVIVAPPPGEHHDDYYAAWRDPLSAQSAFSPVSEQESGVLHSGFPFLVVSRRPVGVVTAGKTPFAAVNLATLDAEGLTLLIDDLVEAAYNGLDLLDSIPSINADLSHEYDETGGWSEIIAEGIQLRPNVFGMGLDLNAMINWLRRWRASRARSKEIELKSPKSDL
jgi:hypothetical protein